MQIEISGIKIEVQKKNIKNLHLVVAPPDGKVRVSAPMHLSDDSIEMFVRTKLSWIKKQQEKFEKQPRQSEREYVSGETLYVFGVSVLQRDCCAERAYCSRMTVSAMGAFSQTLAMPVWALAFTV